MADLITAPDDLITFEAGAVRADRTVTTIERWVKAGKLTAWRTVGGRRAIRASELAELLAPRPA
jgi:excisionase family DNA binding protein